jgi:tripartite-type tricarboxylate transporter receptor subunit TctC
VGILRLALAAALLWSAAAAAQQYPTKPIRWIVPTGAGSAVDVTARRIAPRLAEALGQPVIVENRPGANSMIGAREVARAPADGYTLFQAVINNALNDVIAPDACCTLNDKLIPVTRLLTTPLVMVVHPSVPANSVKDYVELARAKRGQLTYASGGTASITQMVGELLKWSTKIDVREVPYKAIGAELPDLTGGHVDAAYLAPIAIRDHVKSGRLKALAHTGPKRLEILPDVPTMTEAGYPQMEATAWTGLFVPTGTPPAIVQRLQSEIDRILKSDEIRQDAVTFGSEFPGGTSESFGTFVRGEVQKWGRVVKDAGIKLE